MDSSSSSSIQQHFVFGYGSLICAKSRSITVPGSGDKVTTPVVVKGLERTWVVRWHIGMTCMGVRFVQHAECVGVLLPVSTDELAKFDLREKGYDRVALDLEAVETVPFLDAHQYYKEDEHQVFLNAKKANNNSSEETIKIWVYIQCDPVPPNPEHPIVQTYVDIILRGCLSISPEFAKEFIKTTKGWHPEEFAEYESGVTDKDNSVQDEEQQNGSVWVDDRHDPVYPRADVLYSREKGAELDGLLQSHRPGHFVHRKLSSRIKD